MYFVRAAVARLPAETRMRVLKASAIPPELLLAGDARVPAASFATLWMSIAHELDDEFFGLDRRRMKVGSFAMLCNSVLHSKNLRQAIKEMLRGFSIFLDDISASLNIEDGMAVIRIDNRIASPDDRRFADETFLVMVYGLMCWLVGKRIALASVAFSGPTPVFAREHAVMFSQHLQFDANASAICFDAEELDAHIVQNAGTLKDFLQTAPQSVFLKYKNPHSWTARLRRRLRSCIGGEDWPLLEEVAKEFALTPTTLRRRLEAEGTSYHEVKDALRRDAAIHYLCTTSRSVPDIAGLLCFKEVSAFRRAFKSWTGVQPSRYRTEGEADIPLPQP